MNKKDFIKSLTNIKVVVGNGFDLHCGLKTSYLDFVKKNHETFKFILNWYYYYDKTGPFNVNGFDEKGLAFNTWDVFFAFNLAQNIIDNDINWFDIEKLILSSLLNEMDLQRDSSFTNQYMLSRVHWWKIENVIGAYNNSLTSFEDFLVRFVEQRMEIKNIHDFYPFLLSELKDFENVFGQFINKQIHNRYMEVTNYNTKYFLNEKYIKNFEETLTELCNPANIVSFDTFNYTVVPDNHLSVCPHHINGEYTNPIFGIDSTYFKPNDKRYIFTKTYRRMDNDFNDGNIDVSANFDNLIIYGHSLNEADFNYFFPVFDKLQLLDANQKSIVVFAYSVFNEKRKDEIQSNHVDSISKLFYEYAESKNMKAPERFLDSLTTQGRIIIDEINPVKYNYKNFVDDDWKNIDLDSKELFDLLKTIKF